MSNEDKIPSLYGDPVNVIVRVKAGADVEFGNKLWLGEKRGGILPRMKLRDSAGRGAATLVSPYFVTSE